MFKIHLLDGPDSVPLGITLNRKFTSFENSCWETAEKFLLSCRNLRIKEQKEIRSTSQSLCWPYRDYQNPWIRTSEIYGRLQGPAAIFSRKNTSFWKTLPSNSMKKKSFYNWKIKYKLFCKYIIFLEDYSVLVWSNWGFIIVTILQSNSQNIQ